MKSRELAARFEAYGDWRRRLSSRISQMHHWLEASAFAVYPQSRHPLPKVRALIDYLIGVLGPKPEWDAFKASPRAR